MHKSKLILGALVVVGTVLGTVGTTHADPPGGSGWDENPDVVVGGGSDTTYLMAQRLENLYNTAPGCTIGLAEAAGKADCVPSPGTPSGPTNGNYDHDLLVSATPTGSSAGVDALRVGMAGAPAGLNQYTPAIDYARSSSGPSGTRLDNLTYWGYARDAIIVVSFGARTNLCVTQAQLQGIYNLTITLWNQLTDCNGNPMANVDADPTTNDPIIPWAMNGASGTNASFNTFVTPTNTATNGRRLKATNLAPFENDIKPLLADAGPDNIVGNADDDENNYLWWMSYANYFTYSFTKNGCANGIGVFSPTANTCNAGGTVVPSNPVGVQNLTTLAYVQPSAATINNSSYPITRTVYHVTRNTEADCRVTPGSTGACDNAANTVYGATSGKGGAVREFTQWLCKAAGTPSHAINTVTGRDYRTEIVRALNAEGFQQTSTNSTGYRCSVST